MKKYLLALLLLFSLLQTKAAHITGGEIIYSYVGPGTAVNNYRYAITLRLFRDETCFGNCAQLPASATIGIYDNDNFSLSLSNSIPRSSLTAVPINSFPTCITNAPILNYNVGYYTFEIDLPLNAAGYTISYQTCCRVDGIANIPDMAGATYTANVPGTNTARTTRTDNSPQFTESISVVCFNRPFTLDFSASDLDSDSLVYRFCSGYDAPGQKNSTERTPTPPPYPQLSYTGGYSGSFPLGPDANINSQTGIISGIAPGAGKYVVSVCVDSYERSTGRFISTHRKDFIVNVAPCDLAGVELLPSYLSCDGFTFNFSNLNTSPLNQTFFWDFGDGNTSTDAAPVHTYALAGDYTVKLVVNRGDDCADSLTSPLKVYPGFFPSFTSTAPTCKDVPVQFTDGTTANYGSVNYWKWDFGVNNLTNDTSRLRNPTYAYATPNPYTVRLIVGSDRGCIDTVEVSIDILDKAPYTLTKDTLICSIDTLRLNFATPNPGTITWSPNYMISNVNVFNPLVSPDVTTTYRFSYVDNFGCSATDSIRVRVVDRVTLSIMNDTTICRTDSVNIRVDSDGLQYAWTNGSTLNNTMVQDPVATPTAALTNYIVTATIGKCEAREDVNVRTVPYPIANAGPDSTICFGNSIQLNASGGSIYSWSPRIFLNNSNISNPVSQAPQSDFIDYVVTVSDILGCPKPVKDTMRLTIAKIIADAGPADTNVVLGQPLLLNATGSVNYQWTPNTWLSNPGVFNPISLPQESIEYVVRVSNDQGCFDTDTINVKLYKIDPDLLVPTAFSPDGDGVNDIFRPIVIGMKSLDAFRVYNRWGQLLFSTTRVNSGWDGKFKSAPQSAGTYVWMAEGVTYLGRKIKKKGTVILIR